MATLNITIDLDPSDNIDTEALTRELTRYAHELVSRKATDSEYYISPRIRSLHTGFVCPDNLSADYKSEIAHARSDSSL